MAKSNSALAGCKPGPGRRAPAPKNGPEKPLVGDTPRDTAVRLLAAGHWPVVIRPGEKRPVGQDWGKTPHTVDTLRAAFKKYPDAGVGVCLGPGRGPDGRWPIDIEGDGPGAEESRARLFGGEVPETLGWGSARGGHGMHTVDPGRMLAVLARLGAMEGKSHASGVYKFPAYPGLEFRIGGYAEDGTPKQLQSVFPPTKGTDGQCRVWNGVSAIAEVPESFYQALEAAAGPVASPAPVARPPLRPTHGNASRSPEERAIAYSYTCKPAVSGQKGHDQAWKVACKIGPGFDLPEDTAYRVIRDYYNPRCEPPWSEKELAHKVSDAYRLETRRGWLLEQGPGGPAGGSGRGAHEGNGKPAKGVAQPIVRNFRYVPSEGAEDEDAKPAKPVKQRLTSAQIAGLLSQAIGPWPKRVDQALFVQGDDFKPLYIDSTAKLFALADRSAEVHWARGERLITQERFYEYLKMTVPAFDSVEAVPHFPPLTGIYYMHPPLPPASGAIDELLDFFCPLTSSDRELIKAFVLTLLWGGAPGSRPAFLFTGPEHDSEDGQGRGVGKSTLPMAVAEELLGGYLSVSPNEDIEDIKTRMLTPSALQQRVAMLDNIKTLNFSWGDLESLITTTRISGRALYVGDMSRPNLFVWCLTLNGASLSKDMAQRVIPVRLDRPRFQPDWEARLRSFIREKRTAIMADAKFLLSRCAQSLQAKSRWAAWECEVLAATLEPAASQALIIQRQGAIDSGNTDRDLVAEYFAGKIEEWAKPRTSDEVFVTLSSQITAEWISTALRSPFKTGPATTFLERLDIPELKRFRDKRQRGWQWRGKQVPPEVTEAENPLW